MTEHRLKQAHAAYLTIPETRAEFRDAIWELVREGWAKADVARYLEWSPQRLDEFLKGGAKRPESWDSRFDAEMQAKEDEARRG